MDTKNVVMVGNSVVDYVYKPIPDEGIENDFFSALPDLVPDFVKDLPRPGDTLFVLAEMLEEKAAEFLKRRGKFDPKAAFNGTPALEQLFGTHEKYAGGSLANTVAALQHSFVGGKPLVNAKIVSTLAEGLDGDTIAAAVPEGSVAGSRYGNGLICHVIPVGDDRTMITTPHITRPSTEHNLAEDVAKSGVIDETTDIVMFEGFAAHDEEHFEDIFDTMLAQIKVANAVRRLIGVPPVHLVLTASSQGVAAMPKYRAAVERATLVTDVTVHSNTGEFRRLMDADVEWRKPFAPVLEGIENAHELDEAKKHLEGYREAKTQANIDTILSKALPLAWKTPHKLRFVMTDGGNTAYVADRNGYREYKPARLDKKDIVGRVGAGDAQMAGFWASEMMGGNEADSMASGFKFATACIRQEEARLSPALAWPEDSQARQASGPVAILGGTDVMNRVLLGVTALSPDIMPRQGLKDGP